jgi:Spy/CpxP family protein refolding chaperone
MKKNVLVVIIICLASINTGLFAQQRQTDEGRKERFEKFKVEREAYISKTMNLTEEEKSAFWPLCNEFQMKKFELNKTLRQETRKIYQARKDNQALTEADYKKIIELSIRTKAQEAQLEKEYTDKFLQVIPAEKVFLYQQAEQQFGKTLIEQRDKPNAPSFREKKGDANPGAAKARTEKRREKKD